MKMREKSRVIGYLGQKDNLEMSKEASGSEHKVKNLRELAAWLEGGSTARADLVIGAEHEKFIFDAVTHKAALFEGPKGLEKLLDRLSMKGWTPVDEDGRVIELRRNTATVSLEPSGQLEHATPVYKSLHDVAREIDSQVADAAALAEDLGLNMVGLGYHPIEKFNELPRIPKTRYRNFDECMSRMDGQEQNGMNVLYSTAAAQANIGFENEADMVKKLRVTLSLQPVVTAIFANSPFRNGAPSGLKSTRSHIIRNAVNGRYGFMLPVAFEEGFGFERFAEYALNEMPMMGFYENGRFIGAPGARFVDFVNGRLEASKGREATLNDWENHLNCIWPEVRLRRFLEMRGADAGPKEMLQALPALWVGLAYDPAALDQAYEMVRDWSHDDREYLRLNAPVQGLDLPFLGTTLQQIAGNMLALSVQGLKNRTEKNVAGLDESYLLEPLFEIVNSNKTWSDRLLSSYHGEWGGDIRRVFNAMSYKNMPSVLGAAPVHPSRPPSPPKA